MQSNKWVLLVIILISCHPKSETNNTASNSSNDDCGYNDGTYSADIDYYNASTGYSANYTLDVEVEDCQVVQIDFNNGGYLDSDHIDAADIDDDGVATVTDDRNRTYEVHLSESDKNSSDDDDN